jgi:hypothetical protein
MKTICGLVFKPSKSKPLITGISISKKIDQQVNRHAAFASIALENPN